LLKEVEAGKEVIVTRGKKVAKLVPIENTFLRKDLAKPTPSVSTGMTTLLTR